LIFKVLQIHDQHSKFNMNLLVFSNRLVEMLGTMPRKANRTKKKDSICPKHYTWLGMTTRLYSPNVPIIYATSHIHGHNHNCHYNYIFCDYSHIYHTHGWNWIFKIDILIFWLISSFHMVAQDTFKKFIAYATHPRTLWINDPTLKT
jgi:hypothetical protein